MPEWREHLITAFTIAFIILIQLGLEFGSEMLLLINIWVDATLAEVEAEEEREVDEQKLSPDALEQRTRILRHQPYRLRSGSKLTRGSSAASGRSKVWPEGISSLRSLRLIGVDFTARSIILDFGPRILTVRLINHTSAQVYRKSQWESSVRDVPAHKSARQFKIAIALEFSEFVIAFVSADLVFEPHWYDCIEDMHHREPPPDFAFPCKIPTTADDMKLHLSRNPPQHLPLSLKAELNVRDWMMSRRKSSPRNELAILVVRKFERVFPGEGVYTTCEVWKKAGLSPYITEAELFDCPSMAARLLEATFSLMKDAYDNMFKTYVRPALHGDGTILAPTQEQRIRCGMGAFHVFAKVASRVTQRMRRLQQMYLDDIENGRPVRYDVFEPALIASAFDKDVHLGSLIFGRELFDKTGIKPSAAATGPLEATYTDLGLIDAPTHLCAEEYQPAFPKDLNLTAAKMNHYAFRVRTNAPAPSTTTSAAPDIPSLPSVVLSDAQPARVRYVRGVVWTIIPPHPSNAHFHRLKMLSHAEMVAATFETVVTQTKQVVVGPLEFFGNGIYVRNGKKIFIATCQADPVVFPAASQSDAFIKFMRGRERRRFVAQNPHLSGVPTPADLVSKVNPQIRALSKARSTVAALSGFDSTPPPPIATPKDSQPRRRVSADARLILEAGGSIPSIAQHSSQHAEDHIDADAFVPLESPRPSTPSSPRLVADALPEHPVYSSSGRAILEEENCGDDDVDAADLLSEPDDGDAALTSQDSEYHDSDAFDTSESDSQYVDSS